MWVKQGPLGGVIFFTSDSPIIVGPDCRTQSDHVYSIMAFSVTEQCQYSQIEYIA